jgi:hypothetical protein
VRRLVTVTILGAGGVALIGFGLTLIGKTSAVVGGMMIGGGIVGLLWALTLFFQKPERPPVNHDGSPPATKRLPRLTALEPRVAFVSERTDGGFVEQPTAARFMSALVADFRHDPSTPPAPVVRAQIDFHDRDGIHQRVNYGCWLGEDVNWASFEAADTRSLLVLLGDGRPNCISIDDDRHEARAGQMRTKPKVVTSDPVTAVVKLVFLDGHFGFTTSQTFRFALKLKEFTISSAEATCGCCGTNVRRSKSLMISCSSANFTRSATSHTVDVIPAPIAGVQRIDRLIRQKFE